MVFRKIGHVLAVQHPVDQPSIRLQTLEGAVPVEPGEWVLQGGHNDQWPVSDSYVTNYLVAPAAAQRALVPNRAELEARQASYFHEAKAQLDTVIEVFEDVLGQTVTAAEAVDRVRLFVNAQPAYQKKAAGTLSDVGWKAVRDYVDYVVQGTSIAADAHRIVSTKQGLGKSSAINRFVPASRRLSEGLPEHPTPADLDKASAQTLNTASTSLSRLEATYAAVVKIGRIRPGGIIEQLRGVKLEATRQLLKALIDAQPEARDVHEFTEETRLEVAVESLIDAGSLSRAQARHVRSRLVRIDAGLMLNDLAEGWKGLYTRGDHTDSSSGPSRLRTTTELVALETVAREIVPQLSTGLQSEGLLAGAGR